MIEIRNVSFAKFEIVMEALETVELPPYKGSAFRGAFGRAFKNAVCPPKKPFEIQCSGCSDFHKCIYPLIFETMVPPDKASILRSGGEVPRPFIIEPPLENKTEYKKGDRINLKLILIGEVMRHLPVFINSFSMVSKNGVGAGRGKMRLVEVSDTGHNSIGKRFLYSDSEGFLPINENYKIYTDEDIYREIKKLPGDRIDIRFTTPFRAKQGKHYVRNIDFETVARCMMRRISAVSVLYWDTVPEWDYKAIVENSKSIVKTADSLRWRDWERYSSRRDERIKLGGFVGDVSFEGDISDFLPLLKLGEHLHIGKNATFGLGKYKIITI